MALTNGQQPLYACLNHQQNFSGLVDTDDPLELLTNDWTEDGAMTIVDGSAICDPEVEAGFITQTIDPQYANVNLPLRVVIVVTSITQGNFIVTGPDLEITTPGTHTINVEMFNGDFTINSAAFCDAVIDSISLKLMNDAQLGPELVTNGDFSSGTGWVLTSDPGFAIAGGKLTANNASVECYAVNTAAVVDELEMYKIVIAVADVADDAGIYAALIETAPDEYNGTLDDNGWYANGTFTLYAVADETGSVALYFPDFGVVSADSLSVRKYT